MSLIDHLIASLLGGRLLPYPRAVSIEPVGGVCQLKCPLCPTGWKAPDGTAKLLSLATFREFLDKLPFVSIVELYRSGEPFLNPELLEMIRHASGRGLKVVVSSHFSFQRDDAFFEELVRSGLERLVISLDGVSQAAYEQYRVGGDVELVLANLKRVLAARQRLKSDQPEVVWQYLVNRYNEPELDEARRLAASWGIKLDVRPMDLDDELPDVELAEPLEERRRRWLPRDERYWAERYRGEYHLPLYPGTCADLFTRAVITAHGKVMPCCLTWDPANNFGDLLAEPFEAIWHGPLYRAARQHFLAPGDPGAQPICRRCANYAARPSLKDKLALVAEVYRKQLAHWGR